MKYLLPLTVMLCLFTKLNAQHDSLKNEIAKYDSSILKKTHELNIKDSSIKEANKQLEISTQKVEQLKSEIKKLIANNIKTEDDNKKLREEYEKLNDAIDQQELKSQSLKNLNKELTSITNEKEKIKQNKDSTILILNAEIEQKIRKKDSLQHVADSVQKKENTLIAQRQALISKQLDSLEVISTISIQDSVPIYHASKKDTTSVRYKIKEVNITVKEGIIQEIIVRTADGIFRNKNNIIPLLHIGEVFIDKFRGRLQRENQKYKPQGQYQFIYLDDVINYNVIRSYKDVAYGDFEIKLLPTGQDSVYLIRESTSINTYFNIAGFTDIKGLSGDPNGLAQFNADAKFITQTKNIKNSSWVLFNYIAFQGGLSKFDNDFKGSRLYNKDSINRKDLFQRAIYSVGIKANLIKGFAHPSPTVLFNNIQLNLGYNVLGSRVYDTLQKGGQVIDTIFKTVTQNQFFIEPSVTFDRHHNFAITISSPLSFISVKHNAQISNRDWELWLRPSVSLMYYGKREPGNKIFFRYNQYINLKQPTEAFTQMQLGFSVNLTEVWHKENK
ncbi:coiled-coil domain-containing protein [Niastella sp. OAS944]|uniref:coiled-coil domain-containing protein n=1 Tax=Niastella sp. OAS944 TaxID=2664089 RepID=UPI00346CADA8|nr:hypothetical protein [Chitinophagaceae bacterium OAS944]